MKRAVSYSQEQVIRQMMTGAGWWAPPSQTARALVSRGLIKRFGTNPRFYSLTPIGRLVGEAIVQRGPFFVVRNDVITGRGVPK